MGHVQRLALGSMFIFATFALSLVIDSAGYELLRINKEMGVDQGPFAPVLGHIDGVMSLLIPMLLFGIVVWIIWGAVKQERQEEARRRVGP